MTKRPTITTGWICGTLAALLVAFVGPAAAQAPRSVN